MSACELRVAPPPDIHGLRFLYTLVTHISKADVQDP